MLRSFCPTDNVSTSSNVAVLDLQCNRPQDTKSVPDVPNERYFSPQHRLNVYSVRLQLEPSLKKDMCLSLCVCLPNSLVKEYENFFEQELNQHECLHIKYPVCLSVRVPRMTGKDRHLQIKRPLLPSSSCLRGTRLHLVSSGRPRKPEPKITHFCRVFRSL